MGSVPFSNGPFCYSLMVKPCIYHQKGDRINRRYASLKDNPLDRVFDVDSSSQLLAINVVFRESESTTRKGDRLTLIMADLSKRKDPYNSNELGEGK